MDDSNSTNLTIIVVLLIFVVGIGIFSFSLKLTSNDKKKTDDASSDEVIKDDTSVDDNSNIYDVYNIGDNIKLTDNSSWHIIEKSFSNESEVTILSDNDIGKISVNNIENYLEETYYNELQQSLNASDGDISEIRLLDIDDIMSLTNISNIVVGGSIEKSGFDWLYTTTLINYRENNTLGMICERQNDTPARICLGTGSDIFPVRPVITIKKSYIIKEKNVG